MSDYGCQELPVAASISPYLLPGNKYGFLGNNLATKINKKEQ